MGPPPMRRTHLIIVCIALAAFGACSSHDAVDAATPCTTNSQCTTAEHCALAQEAVEQSVCVANDSPASCSANGSCQVSQPLCQNFECTDPCIGGPCGQGAACQLSIGVGAGYTCAAMGALCGNLRADPHEECDGSALGGMSCTQMGYGTGTLHCNAACNYDASDCSNTRVPPPTCGNNILDVDEECDGTAFDANATCAYKNFPEGGTVSCNAKTCLADTSTCFACGNNAIEGNELCDGTAIVAGQTCAAFGYEKGSLACGFRCQVYDFSDCSTCGDGAVEGEEVCDGALLNQHTCVSLGFKGGALACGADCSAFDTSQCYYWYGIAGSDGPQGVSRHAGTSGGAYSPTLTIDGSGNPIVAWVDDSAVNCLLAMTAVDGNWRAIGGTGVANVQPSCSNDSATPRLSYDAGDGGTRVIWTESATSSQILLAQTSVTGWIADGNASNVMPGISNRSAASFGSPALAAAPGSDTLIAVWEGAVTDGSVNEWRIYAKMRSNGAWADLLPGSSSGQGLSAGTSAAPQGEDAAPSVTVDANGMTYIAWVGGDTVDNANIFVVSLAPGASALTFLPSPSGGMWGRQPILMLDNNGALLVTYRSSGSGQSVLVNVVTRRLTAGGWVDVGDSGGLGYDAKAIAAVVDSNNNPIVAWQDSTTGTGDQIFAARWNGQAWGAIDTSLNAAGLSNSSHQATSPALAWRQSSSGALLCIAWEYQGATVDNVTPAQQIQVLCRAM